MVYEVNRRQKTEDRRQKTVNRRQKTEDRKQKTVNRRQKTEDRKQKTEDREKQMTKQAAGYKLQVAGCNFCAFLNVVSK